jgi:hypothetical protein
MGALDLRLSGLLEVRSNDSVQVRQKIYWSDIRYTGKTEDIRYTGQTEDMQLRHRMFFINPRQEETQTTLQPHTTYTGLYISVDTTGAVER